MSEKKQKAIQDEPNSIHEQNEDLLLDGNEPEINDSTADDDLYTEDDDATLEDVEHLENEITDEMADDWRNEFENMNADEQQRTLYNILVERLYYHIAYYMRRYPQRMASSRSTYSDRCVGIEEVRNLMGEEDNGFSQTWLELNAIPEIQDIEARLIMLNAQFYTLMNCDDNESAIAHLQMNFQLSDLELSILATLVIAMNEEAVMRLMCVAWADFTVRMPTVSFIANLLGDTPDAFEAVKEALSEQGKLRRLRLIIGEQHGSFHGIAPQIYTPLSVDQDVIDAFCGYIRTRELPPNVKVYKKSISLDKLVCNKETAEEIKYALDRPKCRICLVGPTHSGRRTLLCAIAMSMKKKPIMEINVCREFDPVPEYDLANHLAVIMRRTLLYGGILMLRFDGLEEHPELIHKFATQQTELNMVHRYYPGEIVMLSRSVHTIIDEDFEQAVFVKIPALSVEAAEKVWNDAMMNYTEPERRIRMAEAFSKSYSLPIGTIFRVVSAAVDAQLTLGVDKVELKSHHILNEIQKSFNHELGDLAEVCVSDMSINGVILNDDCKKQVKGILEYARNLYTVLFTWGFKRRSPYGNSLSMLFAGPPGTGKTLLANALANELGKVLYRVDLSRIVDKYIGETEKNLGRVFDEAAKAQAIILFDEADALFSKRSEVKSSNDRHANQEINYLLQKLESYNGITILTTNLSKSIDDAFRRRIRFIVDFPMPDAKARASLWKRMIPPEAPIEKNIRWSWLADTFEMSGGHIRNAVLKASIAAAAAKAPINMEHLANAAIEEAHAMGMLIRVEDGEYEEYDGDYDNDEPDDNKWF